ncbi:MAG: hypothetical protein H6707_18105 [Deltaproteobacteria bacterium]|nr:hypothetical protein [Deltaproteobacteria bacterium]
MRMPLDELAAVQRSRHYTAQARAVARRIYTERQIEGRAIYRQPRLPDNATYDHRLPQVQLVDRALRASKKTPLRAVATAVLLLFAFGFGRQCWRDVGDAPQLANAALAAALCCAAVGLWIRRLLWQHLAVAGLLVAQAIWVYRGEVMLLSALFASAGAVAVLYRFAAARQRADDQQPGGEL